MVQTWPGMIVSTVSLSCVRCPGGEATITDASAPPVPPSLSPTGHTVVAVCLGLIGTFGFLSNFMVLALFCRYRILRTPMNLLLVSISASDLLVCLLGTPFSFAASTQGRWLIGRAGCVWYGFVNSCLGIVSLISLAVLSYERYSTMMSPSMADARDYRPALGGICFSWFYSVAWTVPPLLGWSRYGPEGPGTTCSVDWSTQTANNISYIICLFIFCLVLPFGVIVYSYGRLLCAVRQVHGASSAVCRRREQRVLVMVITMVVCYLVCWLPYGVVALLATFGPRDVLTPEASITPSLLAKFSTVINPFIYIFLNKQFCRCFVAFIRCSPSEQSTTLKTLSRVTKTPRIIRLANEQNVYDQAMSSAPHTPNSTPASFEGANHVSPLPSTARTSADVPKPKVILVAHYRK